ncbi:MAG: hypothetical protein OCU18_00690 [Candidatus Syntrophoarchaeum sp.]|nr:hypothetical protein [Candidatus Syntrophoarchaeum sp.]
MEKIGRPHHDFTEEWAYERWMFETHILGRPGDSKRETPIKLTQSLDKYLQTEVSQWWRIGMLESSQTVNLWTQGLLVDPENTTVTLGYPPCYSAAVPLDPAATIALFGKSLDLCWLQSDNFSGRANPHTVSYHYEDGVMTYIAMTDPGEGQELVERKHMKVGKEVKDLPYNYPAFEAVMLIRDVMMDARNEDTPEYAMSAYHQGCWQAHHGYNESFPSRSTMDAIMGMYPFFNCEKMGWPFKSTCDELPRPVGLELLVENPPDIFTWRWNALILGENWSSKYTISPHELHLELQGMETIPCTPEETARRIIRYGMDRYVFPETFKQSTYIYGDEARVQEPTEYPLPAKTVVSHKDATDLIYKARKEHPEWIMEV